MKEIILLKMTKKWQKDLLHIIQNFRLANHLSGNRWTRTIGPLINSQMLPPTELYSQVSFSISYINIITYFF